MSQSISIPDDLYHHLTEQAQKNNPPLETLLNLTAVATWPG